MVVLNPSELTERVDITVAHNALLSDESRRHIAAFYAKFRSRVVPVLINRDINTPELFELVYDMMQAASKIRVAGSERKQIILEMLLIVIDTEVPEDKRGFVKDMVNMTISPAIDLAIFSMKNKDRCKKWLGPLACC